MSPSGSPFYGMGLSPSGSPFYGLGESLPAVGPLPWTIDQPPPIFTLNNVATVLAVAGGALGLYLSFRSLKKRRRRRR